MKCIKINFNKIQNILLQSIQSECKNKIQIKYFLHLLKLIPIHILNYSLNEIFLQENSSLKNGVVSQA